jgi:murein DD-endopeptidase MepM/ murein hydrolase activator NlpD
MRPNSRVFGLATLATATAALAPAALTMPARAQAQRADAAGPATVAQGSAAVLGDAERRAAFAPRRKPDPGPFHPVIGQPDYGSGDAGFGAARSGHVHAGQDVFAPAGTALVAVDEVVVVEAGSDGGRGNYLALHDRERDQTYVYFHMNGAAEVSRGEKVEAGQRVGEVGCTGSCWGDHLHFEVRAGSDPYARAMDPLGMLKEWKSLDSPR